MRKPNESTLVDRAIVRELIRDIGAVSLVFAVSDLRAELDRPGRGGPKLAQPSRLGEYVTHHVGSLIEKVDGTSRGRRRYVLRERRPQLDIQGVSPVLSDADRTSLALWLAAEVEGDGVPTSSVTTVLNAIEALRPTGRLYPTATRLQNLAGAKPPRAENRKPEGERWVRWTPVGERPDDEVLQRYLAEAAQALSGNAARNVDRTTKSGVVVDLVSLAIKRTSRSWPGGTPVRISDIQAAGATEAGAPLIEALLAGGGTVTDALGNAARPWIAGAARTRVLVQRRSDPMTGSTYYDVPSLPGHESRVRYLDWVFLKNAGRGSELDKLVEESRAARELLRSPADVVRAIGAARAELCIVEVGGVMERAAGLMTLVGELSGRTRDSLLTHNERIRGYADRIHSIVPSEQLEGWMRAVADPEAVLRAPRPLCSTHDVEALLPGQMRGGKSADRWLRDAVGLRRYDNPHYVGPQSEDPSGRVRRMVDRVDLLSYICTRYRSAMTPWVAASARLLGRNLRSVELARALADHPDPRVASKGLGCLALIGSGDDVESRAYRAITDQGASFEVVQASLWALLLVRRIDLECLRVAVAGRGTGAVLRAAQEVARAANSGRWVCPG